MILKKDNLVLIVSPRPTASQAGGAGWLCLHARREQIAWQASARSQDAAFA